MCRRVYANDEVSTVIYQLLQIANMVATGGHKTNVIVEFEYINIYH